MKPIYVTRSSMPDFEEYIEEIRGLWDSRILTNQGEKCRELGRRLAEYLEVEQPSVSLFCNGHLALETALEAFELHGEVITTPFTFASTTQAILRKGLTPVFCDVKPGDYTMDPDKIEELITERTSAIVPVHVYGRVCDHQAIERIAGKYGLRVIYDAAHAFGVKVDGQSVATFGDASMYSFHATKVFHTIEGGALVYRDAERRPIVEAYRNFGITGPDTVEYVGGNAKMNEFSAAMGLCNLRHLPDEIARRGEVDAHYRARLCGVPGIEIPPIGDKVSSNYAYFPIFLDGSRGTRDQILARLAEAEIYGRKYFYPLTNLQDCHRGTPWFGADRTPVAKEAASRVMTLPMYADLTSDEIDRICDLILKG